MIICILEEKVDETLLVKDRVVKLNYIVVVHQITLCKLFVNDLVIVS